MKIRNGFVSNSSSSSFIIAFKEKPKSAEELKEILYSEKDTLYWDDDYNMPTELAAKIIFNDLDQSVSEEEMLEELDSGSPINVEEQEPHFHYFSYGEETEDTREQRLNKYFEERKQFNNAVLKSFTEKTAGMLYFIVEYSDNEGPDGVTLEHSHTFEKIPHICINKH